jgi:Holliday junction resolvasome RuvABC endonuclease subunit
MNPYTRVEAVLLALDPAKGKSGAAILRPEGQHTKLVMSLVVTKQSERETFVLGAKEIAEKLDLPLIVVAEEWDPPRGSRETRVDKRWNYPTILGMGEGWGRWTAEFERFGVSEKDVVRATPNTWRDALYGKPREQDSKKLKQVAVDYIHHRLKLKLPHDAAEAVCLGLWGAHAIEVLKRAESWFRTKRKSLA